MRSLTIAAVFYLILVPLIAWIYVWQSAPKHSILHAACDPTRELWRDLNQAFREDYEQRTGTTLGIQMSHGGSGSQARAVIDGLEADVVSLALWSDTDAIRAHRMMAERWEERLPNRSLPYYSTIVFVVRAGNPKQIVDWPDLIRPGVAVITPNPKTSGNGRLSFLAAWGATLRNGGSVEDARQFVTAMYRQTPVLDTAARGSAMTFSHKGLGDVHLTWENEAHLEVKESKGKLQIVYPRRSIRAEPHVAWVDRNVDRKGTLDVTKQYLEFLYTEKAQHIIARNFHRPIRPDVLRQYASHFKAEGPEFELFDVQVLAKDWADAQRRFFGDGGVFDEIYKGSR